MKVDSNSPLAKTGLDAAIHQMRTKLRKPFDESHVEFSLDAVNAELIVDSLERSSTGAYGKYAGSARLSYLKVSLQTVLPYPIVYRGEYPVLFVKLRQWLETTYGLIIEENEFVIEGGPQVPLIDNIIMSTAVDVSTGLLRLRALPTSGRFVAGTWLNLLMVPSNGPVRLQGLIPASVVGDMADLSYAA